MMRDRTKMQLEAECDALDKLARANEAGFIRMQAERDALAAQLQEQLNDCINFNGGKLTDGVMERSSQLLKGEAGDALTRLKAEWQAEALEWADNCAFAAGCFTPKAVTERIAELRRQAEKP